MRLFSVAYSEENNCNSRIAMFIRLRLGAVRQHRSQWNTIIKSFWFIDLGI